MTRRGFLRTLFVAPIAAAVAPALIVWKPRALGPSLQPKHYKVWISNDPTFEFGFSGYNACADGPVVEQLKRDLAEAARAMREQVARDVYLHGQGGMVY